MTAPRQSALEWLRQGARDLGTIALTLTSRSKRPQNACSRCGHTWFPRGKNVSSCCPRCGCYTVYLWPGAEGCGWVCLVAIVFGLVVSAGQCTKAMGAVSSSSAGPAISVIAHASSIRGADSSVVCGRDPYRWSSERNRRPTNALHRSPWTVVSPAVVLSVRDTSCIRGEGRDDGAGELGPRSPA